jgi:hypothetical protein
MSYERTQCTQPIPPAQYQRPLDHRHQALDPSHIRLATGASDVHEPNVPQNRRKRLLVLYPGDTQGHGPPRLGRDRARVVAHSLSTSAEHTPLLHRLRLWADASGSHEALVRAGIASRCGDDGDDGVNALSLGDRDWPRSPVNATEPDTK